MGTFFQFLFRLTKRYRWLFLALLIAIVGMAGYLASKLRFSEDITKVLPLSEKINNLNFVYSNAKFMDKVVFNISLQDTTLSANPVLLSQFADQFIDSLRFHFVPNNIKSIDAPPNDAEILEVYDVLYDNLPLFLDEDDYLKIDSLLTENSITKTIESNYNTIISPMGMGTRKMIAKDPLHLTPIALNKLRTFRLSENLKLFNDHFLSTNDRNLLVLITPSSTNNTAANQELFDGIDRIIGNLQKGGFETVKAEYFGSPVVALGNAQRIKKDIIITVSLALIVLILFISFFFKRKRSFFIIFTPVAFGAVVSIAALYVFQSEVSAISLGIGSVLIGISLDYSLHIFSHYRKHHNIKLLYKDLSTPIILSSVTTAGAFISLRFINSQALNDLGLFAAISVLSAAFFSLVVLPHFLPRKKESLKVKKGIIDRIAAFDFSKVKYLNLGIFVITIIFVFLSRNVIFDADMMKSNYMSKELSQAEVNLNKVTSLSEKTVYLVTPGRSMNKALLENERTAILIDSLKDAGIIRDATVVSDLFHSIEGQEAAIKRWKSFWSVRKDKVINDLSEIGGQYKFKASAFSGFYEMFDKEYQPVLPDQIPVLSKLYFDNFTINTDSLSAVINVVKVSTDSENINLVYDTFDNNPGVWIIDKRMITSEFIGILKDNFDRLLYISLALVFLILLIAYGRIELTVVTMIPIFFSWIWTVGIMGLLGISFNIFNIIILTFIFGLGIDYSIFIMRGLLQKYKYGTEDISSYKVSVIVSVITTLLGIGVLIFAKHPALKSIATMSIIGILSVVVITFTLLPAIFKWMISYKKGPRNRPVTLLDFLFSLMSLFIFVGGALLMSLFSFFLRILPGNTKKKKYIFHVAFNKLTWFLIYANFLSPKKIINPLNEDYSKPAIIIANHQSHIDLMLMMLLNPRVLILTNRKNYTHPFYGKALQYADFLPSDIGYDAIANKLKALIDDGYSFMIFPEGHRNDDGTIKRFHKGAFYLASKLNIDILPIIIHGQNQSLKKSELFLKRGYANTVFLPRINLSKQEFGTTVREQTKGINAYFRKEFAKAREEFETPDYYHDYIIKNFIFKGPVLEWYTRIKSKIEDDYKLFNNIIPRNCTITDLGCGYGYLSFMLSLVSEERKIVAVDYDEDKIAVASNCAINNERISFVAADITQIALQQSDVFVLKDVLHYLPEESQLRMIERCLEKTNLGGMIIIRDSDRELKQRHQFTKLTEFFSTNFGFNKTENKLDFVSRSMIEDLAIQRKLKLEIVDTGKRTSNLLYILQKK